MSDAPSADRLHHIGIGRRWATTLVLMLIHELDIRIVDENTGELVRELVLDPPATISRGHHQRPRCEL